MMTHPIGSWSRKAHFTLEINTKNDDLIDILNVQSYRQLENQHLTHDFIKY